MKLCLIIAYFGNIIDTAATLYFINKGFIEANPLMTLLLKSPWLFVLVKIGVMTAVIARIWVCREDKYAQIASWVVMTIYGVLLVYYGFIAIWLLSDRRM